MLASPWEQRWQPDPGRGSEQFGRRAIRGKLSTQHSFVKRNEWTVTV
jgi:hypothetical protein